MNNASTPAESTATPPAVSFWQAFSKAHPDGRRLSQVFERGLGEFKRDGRYRSMMQAFRRSQGLP